MFEVNISEGHIHTLCGPTTVGSQKETDPKETNPEYFLEELLVSRWEVLSE